MTKINDNLRQRMHAARNALSAEAKKQAGTAVLAQVRDHALLDQHQHFAFYYPVHGELDPRPLLEWVSELGKTCYLPKITEQTIQFHRYSPGDLLIPNHYDILEPGSTPQCENTALDVVFTPIVAFDRQGNRLGFGAGFYDRAFSFLKQSPRPNSPLLIGLAHAEQCVEQLIAESWDVSLDGVITPDELLLLREEL